MSRKRIRYGQLYDYLESLGYRAEAGPTYLVYRKPGTRLPIILPKRPRNEEAWPPNLVDVRHTLELDGVVKPPDPFSWIDSATPKRGARASKPKVTSTKAAKPKVAKAAKPKAIGTKAAMSKAKPKAAKARRA